MIKLGKLFSAYILFSGICIAQRIQYLTPQVMDFGSVKEDSLLQGEILFVNTGSDPINIRNVRTSCGCTAVQALEKKCAPGDTMGVSFSFDTRGYDGLVRKSITILFQEDDIENANFVIQTNIIQVIDIRPKNFRFGISRSNPDSVITDMLTIHNYWDQPLRIDRIHEINDMIRTIPASAVIQPGEEQQIEIQFHLSQINQRYITLTIETNYDQNPRISVPVLIDTKN